MELARVLRILRQRWLIFTLISVAGFVAGFGFTQLANDDVEPVFEASVPVRFDPDEGQTVEDLAEQVQDEQALAVLATQSLLAEFPSSSIFADTASGRLIFSARASSSEEALTRARSLVDAYFETDPVVGGNIEERLENLRQRASEIEQQIEQIEPSLSPEERALVQTHDLLDRQIQAVEDQLVLLTVGDAGASEAVLAENAGRREQLQTILDDLLAEKIALPERPSDELSADDRLRLAGLERSLEIIQLDYERLFLRTVGVGSEGRVEPAGLSDLTPTPANALVNGAVGLVLGAMIAGFGLIGISRARKEVWLVDDLPMPVLAEVPDRRVSTVPGPTWYDQSSGGIRKESIQALRTALEGTLDDQSPALALVADGIDALSHHALAVDVGASFASAGRSVLLVDADYNNMIEMSEFNVGEPSLGTVLRFPTSTSERLAQRIDAFLDECVRVRRGLAVMPCGVAPSSTADAFAGPQFGLFISRAKEKFDLVLIITDSSRSAASRVLIQRSRKALLAVSPGRTTTHSVNSFVRDLRNLPAKPVGAVVVNRERRSVRALGGAGLSWPKRKERAPGPGYDPSSSPVTRLSFYPSADGGVSGRPGSTSLENLISEIGEEGGRDAIEVDKESSERGHELGQEVLNAIEISDPSEAYGPVAEYIVTRVEDIMTASAGQTSLSPELIEVVLRQGFVALVPVRDHFSAEDLLTAELEWELGVSEGRELFSRFESILCNVEGKSYETLAEWLVGEFFVHHIERTGGEPEIWHLRSERGALHVLVYGRRLTRERLTQLNVDLTRRMIDECERRLESAHDEVADHSIAALEERLRELRAFEVNLGTLQSGSSEEARITYPWRRLDHQPDGWAPVWSEGIRPNIAPVQRLGLLASPVLSDEELHAVEMTG